jgi:hypothetical protein
VRDRWAAPSVGGKLDGIACYFDKRRDVMRSARVALLPFILRISELFREKMA